MHVNVTQDLEVEAEAEHHPEVGSQPREWGINTHTHIERGKNMKFIYELSLLSVWASVSLDLHLWLSSGPSILPTIHQRLGKGPHNLKAGIRRPTTALTEQVRALHQCVTCSTRSMYWLICSCLKLPLLLFFSLVAWRNTLEDWTPEDWSEDVGVSGPSVYQTWNVFRADVLFPSRLFSLFFL